jgi:pSer/pThr/pTyr-binding forkhead associated (FHA) protein
VLRVPGVSRRHALVRRCLGGIEIMDLGSKNGLIVEGQRVKRTILTPGLQLQIGAAWLAVEEISSSGGDLALLLQNSSEKTLQPSLRTATLEPREDVKGLPPANAALALAYHITQVGAGLPGKRADLLARIKATLGAEAFASFEKTRRGKLRIWEQEGKFLSEETKLLASLTADSLSSLGKQLMLKRTGRLLVAGRGAWFLGASFPEESLAREGWRKEFLRFLADQFFMPVRNLDDVNSEEASRVLALARGNKRRAAALLGVSPGTLYKLLTRSSTPKR